MWIEKTDQLTASFQFVDFPDAMSFMMEVAFACEKMDHHPEWTNIWNRVDIKLSTHSAGNKVTDKDWSLAKSIDKIYQRRKN
ncbi:MAG: 4a-hydroxytetrahydrobiopterin dehydratase [Saprospiraceae bacterium]